MSEDGNTGESTTLRRLGARLVHASGTERIALAIASVVLAFVVGLVIIAAAGYDSALFIEAMIDGAFGGKSEQARTLKFSTSFIITGVAVAVAFRAGVYNIGVQGQFVVGVFATTVAILNLADSVPGGTAGVILLIAAGLVAGMIAGGLYAALPGILKAYAGANEIITTIMLNFIATGVVAWLIQDHFMAANATFPRMENLPSDVEFPQLYFESPSFSLVGLAIGIVAAIVIYVLLEHTAFGYSLVTSGHQQAAAFFAGVNEKRTIVATMTVSGIVAGLAGSVFTIMTITSFSNPEGLPNYGFDAIAVSLLAANNPLGAIPAGLLFGAVESGGNNVGLATDIPNELIDGMFGLVVLFVAAPELFRMAAKRAGLGGDQR